MAINKKLIHFKNKENFEKEVANENILDTSIVFIQDSKEISTHGTIYKTVNWSVLEPNYVSAIMTIDDANSDPVIPVEGDTDWIEGKRCLAKVLDDGSVAICYLSDTDSTKFHDGTEASLDGSMGEFMVDFQESYVKCNEVDGITTVEVSDDDNDGALFRRVLLGAVHGTVYEDNKMHSVITGSIPTTNLNIVQFHNYANGIGTGWDIMDYETRNKVTTLAYAKYGNRDLQAVIGMGDSSYKFVEGSTTSLGNANGEVTNSDGNINNSLLGVENYFNNIVDWMGGIHQVASSTSDLFYIYDGLDVETADGIPTVPYRTIDPQTMIGGYNISKMLWGEHADLFPIATDGDNSNFNTYYADGALVYTHTESEVALADSVFSVCVVGCGGRSAYPGYGGSVFGADFDPSSSFSYCGARLQYRGDITIIENPEEFKQLSFTNAPEGYIYGEAPDV